MKKKITLTCLVTFLLSVSLISFVTPGKAGCIDTCAVSSSAPGTDAVVSGGYYNEAKGDYATVSGGEQNEASGGVSTISGGEENEASGVCATISGGYRNEASAWRATISGGAKNEASGISTTVAGGAGNEAKGDLATISGGEENIASGDYATVSGGGKNIASGGYDTVSGGLGNEAGGGYATVSGGQSNIAQGIYSWAGGRFMQLDHNAARTFVWGHSEKPVTISTPDSFIIHSGNVGIGTPSPSRKLDVVGNVISNAYENLSDARLKKNITPIENALDKVTALQGVEFEWNTEEYPEKNLSEERKIGLIAQEVERVLPEVVSTDDEGYKSIEYGTIVSVLIEAVKELKDQNIELRKQNEALAIRIEALEDR